MAVKKTVLKLSERDAVVKIAGTAGTGTISLKADLKKSNEDVTDQTQHVSICGVQWTGSIDATVTVSRNDEVIMTLNCGASGALEMNGQQMIPDDIQADKDIDFTITGTAAECWIRLKKVSGYTSGSETSVYGQYDDPNRVGASTTMQGSPDYVAP